MNVVTPSSKNHFSIKIQHFKKMGNNDKIFLYKNIKLPFDNFPQKNRWCGHSNTTNLPTYKYFLVPNILYVTYFLIS